MWEGYIILDLCDHSARESPHSTSLRYAARKQRTQPLRFLLAELALRLLDGLHHLRIDELPRGEELGYHQLNHPAGMAADAFVFFLWRKSVGAASSELLVPSSAQPLVDRAW